MMMTSARPDSEPAIAPRPAAAAAARAPTRRRWRDMAIAGGLFALMIAGVVAMAASVGWEETRAQLSRLGWGEVVALLGLSLVNYLMRGLRWHLFTRRLGLGTGLLQDMRHFLGGFAMSVTPGRVGELVRMRWIRRETGRPFEQTAPLVVMDRAADLVAMALILALSLGFATVGISGGMPVAALALAGAFVATRPRLLAALADLGHRLTGRRAPRLFARIRTAARALGQFSAPRVLLPAIALGLAGWLAEGWAFSLLLGWFGADIGIAKALAIFVFATLAGGLTGAPGGVGGAEAAMIGLLMLEGVPLEVSLPATIIIRVTTLWFAIGIGLAVFPFAERISGKARNAVER